MAGSTWPALTAGAKAKASEVEAKFDWLEGDIVPMSGGSKADATYDVGESSFRFRDGKFSRYVSAASGFGVGTVSPSTAFHVVSGSGGEIRGERTGAVGDTSALFNITGYFNTTGFRAARIAISADGTGNSAGSLSFHTSANNTETTQMVILSNGKIGIGDSAYSPSGKLNLRGDGHTNLFSWGGATTNNIGYTSFVSNSSPNQIPIIGGKEGIQFKVGDHASCTVTMAISSAGEITQPLQPAFLVTWAGTSTAITLGSPNTLTASWTEEFDQGGDFSGGVFTAPVTGKYQFAFSVAYDITGGLGSNRYQLFTTAKSYTVRGVTGGGSTDLRNEHSGFSVLANMTAGDVAYLIVSASSNTATSALSLRGQENGTTPSATFFSGYLVA